MARQTENSGLIDLDALQRDMPPGGVRPFEVVPCADVETLPSAPDSLEGLTTSTEDESGVIRRAAPVEPPSVEAPRVDVAPSKRKGLLVAVVLALATLAPATALVRREAAVQPASAAVRTMDRPEARAPTIAPRAEELPTVASLPTSATASEAPPASSVTRAVPVGAKKALAPVPAATLTEATLEATSSRAGDLGDAMRGAVGARSAPSIEAAPTGDANAAQVRPSQGAVVGALGTVLPSARACLGPDAPARSGRVVFRSDGTVASVELSRGGPEDECIRAAIGKAKLSPFLDDTFATRVTVRP